MTLVAATMLTAPNGIQTIARLRATACAVSIMVLAACGSTSNPPADDGGSVPDGSSPDGGSVPDGSSPDGGSVPDGSSLDGGSVPDGSSPDGGAVPDGSSPDGGTNCTLPAGATEGHHVRVIYMVPSDKSTNPRYQANIEQAVRMVQLWLRERTPGNISFQVHDPVVEVVTTEHEAAWYSTNDPSTDETTYEHVSWPYVNAWNDLEAKSGGTLDFTNNRWLVFLDAEIEDDQSTTRAGSSLAVLAGDRLPVLAPELAGGRCRAVGSVAWSATQVLRVPQVPECDPEQGGDPGDDACPNDNLREGSAEFPDSTLTEEQLASFADSEFATASDLPDCTLSCETPVEP